jgi:hypothetical protein
MKNLPPCNANLSCAFNKMETTKTDPSGNIIEEIPEEETPTTPAGGKRSAWMSHVKKTMKAHKGMKLMQVLKLAKKTYKKSRRGGSLAGTAASVGGRRKTRKSKRSRKH